MTQSGDHNQPANWKEDARLAWKFVSALTSICAFALIVAGWGFTSWKDASSEAILAIRQSNTEAILRIETSINEFKADLRSNSKAQLDRYLEHDRRITTLETKVGERDR